MSQQETVPSNTIARDKLTSLIARIEKLETEKKELAADIREIFEEAKGNGFDTKVMREVLRRRAMEAAERREHDEMRDMYEQALGMWS